MNAWRRHLLVEAESCQPHPAFPDPTPDDNVVAIEKLKVSLWRLLAGLTESVPVDARLASIAPAFAAAAPSPFDLRDLSR